MPRPSNTYRTRIDRVVDHIQRRPGSDLSLASLAKVAHFSPYHFHRLFKAHVGETLNHFVRRTRLERAAVLMRSSPGRSLSAIAEECGFGALATLSRTFKEVYGLSPSRWDRVTRLQERKIDQAGVEFPVYSEEQFREMESQFPVTVERVSAMRLAYVRTADSYAEGAFQRIYDRLMDWAQAEGLPAGCVFAMSHDDPDVTPKEKCRLDVAMTVPDGFAPRRGVRLRTVPDTWVARARCTGEFINIHKVWEFLYRHWLPSSRWEPRHLPAMEYFRTQPEDWWRDEVVDLDAWIPIRRLRRI